MVSLSRDKENISYVPLKPPSEKIWLWPEIWAFIFSQVTQSSSIYSNRAVKVLLKQSGLLNRAVKYLE